MCGTDEYGTATETKVRAGLVSALSTRTRGGGRVGRVYAVIVQRQHGVRFAGLSGGSGRLALL
jgi:hypothetical protein